MFAQRSMATLKSKCISGKTAWGTLPGSQPPQPLPCPCEATFAPLRRNLDTLGEADKARAAYLETIERNLQTRPRNLQTRPRNATQHNTQVQRKAWLFNSPERCSLATVQNLVEETNTGGLTWYRKTVGLQSQDCVFNCVSGLILI